MCIFIKERESTALKVTFLLFDVCHIEFHIKDCSHIFRNNYYHINQTQV